MPATDSPAHLKGSLSRILRLLLSRRRTTVRHHPRPKITFVNPRALDHTRLPIEIWLLIIREATYLSPDPLDTGDDLSFLQTRSLRLTAYQASMQMKHSLSLVSKRWGALVKPYLYEFVWISRSVQAKALAHTLLIEFVDGRGSSGRFVRRLHIETPMLERCSPADLQTILEYSPQLAVYADHHSIQRSRYDTPIDPRCSPERLLSLLAHPKNELRRLSWTSYDDVPFIQRMYPLQDMRTRHLEYLELSSCSPTFSALFSDSPDLAALAAMDVRLPELKSLKVTLDNNMFAVLASWEMPSLLNLSVVSADFSYTGAGFYRFFDAHGKALRQLELGHSSSLIEKHYLTTPQHLARRLPTDERFSLARWCPNLRELICSADAEWHWESPDWIAPHVLLPCHPRLEMIAIRDIDARIVDALDMSAASDAAFFPLFEQMASLLRREAFPCLKYVRDMSVESSRMRNERPLPAVIDFWTRVLVECKVNRVWLEDHAGMNITARTTPSRYTFYILVYGDHLEQLVLSGQLFNGGSRSSSPTRSASPDEAKWPVDDDDAALFDSDLAAEKHTAVQHGDESIGMGPGRTGVKGVIRDRNEAAARDCDQRARDAAELARRMEKASLGGKTFLEEERERAWEKAAREGVRVPGGVRKGRFGHLREVGMRGFVPAVEEEDRSVWVVVHIYDGSLDRCDTLDDTLVRLARAHPETKFIRCRAAAIGFASTPSTSAQRAARAPVSTFLSRSSRAPGNVDDEDDPYGDDVEEKGADDEEEEEEEDNVDTDMLPTMLVYRAGELVHNWVRVDWEAGQAGIEDLLQRNHIIQPERVGSDDVGLDDEDELVFSRWDDDS
ncbi:hypothetical protein FA95DRAFT_1569860 [Auriscalpium vulgare]|uniref:Uncharacterized protein n=1 Tax=Auriscalpium vulgare TaxID=40419 RepID=A0ACB8S5Y2_9AGAM|nr:hypothetical protein FA95DRAFT_1569860 [Auriscalpium vulgare]